jgi:hypothetical protein
MKMDKAAATRDITTHFVQDFNDGVLALGMSLDGAIYAACVTEYGYGELSEDPEVRREVLGAINERFSKKTPFVYASDEKALRSIFAALEKKADLEVFQYDIVLSILSDQIAPLIMSSGNIMILFAYHAVRRLIEDMRNQKSQAQELESPTSQEEPTSYQILDAPTYSSKKMAAADDIIPQSNFTKFIGEGKIVERTRMDDGYSLTVQLEGGNFYDVYWPDSREGTVPQDGQDVDVYASPANPGWYDVKPWHDVEATLTNDQLQEVGESLSERAHEKWVEREKAKGNAGDPNMVPYEELPEADKESDRDYAHEFMELLEENGFDIVPQEQ